jgi:hypothetical protein
VIPYKHKNNAENSDNSLESVSKYEYSDSYKDDKLKGKYADPFETAKD